MSAIRPARRLLARCLPKSPSPATPAIPSCNQHSFHTSASRPGPRRPRFRNVKAAEMGLTTPEKVDAYAREKFPDYTPQEKEFLKSHYTPEQLAALEAGEQAIDPKELLLQGRLRDDLYKPDYAEDYATVQPVIDWPVSKGALDLPPPQNFDDWLRGFVERTSRLYGEKALDQVQRAYIRAVRRVKETNSLVDLTEEELDDLEKNPEARKKYMVRDDDKARPEDGTAAADAAAAASATESPADAETHARMRDLYLEIEAEFAKEFKQVLAAGRDEVTRVELLRSELGPAPRFPMSPEIPRVPLDADGTTLSSSGKRSADEEAADPAGEYAQLTGRTGLRAEEAQGLLTKILVRRTVHNQTRLGKIRSLSVVTVAGNGDGWLGVGVAKSTEAKVAELTSRLMAIKNMRPVRRYEDRTIFGNSTAKVSGTVVELRARPPGFGLRVSHRIFEMCRMAGIHDLAARIPRSRNPFNTVQACYQALMNQVDPEEIAMGRGKKLVDARKVYYGGTVL